MHVSDSVSFITLVSPSSFLSTFGENDDGDRLVVSIMFEQLSIEYQMKIEIAAVFLHRALSFRGLPIPCHKSDCKTRTNYSFRTWFLALKTADYTF